MPQMIDKARFFLQNSVNGILKTGGFTVGGGVAGFAASLAIYMLSQVGRIFQSLFMGDSPETAGFLKEFGQGLTNIPGIGMLFKPFVAAIPWIDFLLIKGTNGVIHTINFLSKWTIGGPNLEPIKYLGFFGWVGVLLPITFISGIKPLKEAMDGKQAYVKQLPKEWADYMQAKNQGKRIIAPPKTKLPELEGIASRTFSLYSIFKIVKTLTWCPVLWVANKLTGGMVPKPTWPKRYSKMSDVEKLEELTSNNPLKFWISVEFVAFALSWYSALLTNPEDDDALSRYLRNFSIVGAVWGGVATAVNFYDRIEKKFEELTKEKEAPVALEQENEPEPEQKPKAEQKAQAKNGKKKPQQEVELSYESEPDSGSAAYDSEPEYASDTEEEVVKPVRGRQRDKEEAKKKPRHRR